MASASIYARLTQLLNCAERLMSKLCETKTGRL